MVENGQCVMGLPPVDHELGEEVRSDRVAIKKGKGLSRILIWLSGHNRPFTASPPI
jgi:hypothetical protein